MSNYFTNAQTRNPLLVPDLFQCILDCLATTSDEDYGNLMQERRTLAVLARTCRAISEPSLNRLWRRLSSLLPLIRCFAGVVDVARVKTPPTPLEWDVINRYSFRIQDLTLGGEHLSLHFLRCTNLVLSNLRVSRWTSMPRAGRPVLVDSDLESVAFLWPLLTPKMVTLEVTLDDVNDPKYPSFLDNYPLPCPNLKSIKFCFLSRSRVPVTATQHLSRVICGHADWQRVELSPVVDNVTLKHLGMSSALRVVSLAHASDTTQSDETCFGPADTPFRKVTKLTLTLWNRLDFATHLLRAHDQMFRSFQVVVYTLPTTTEISALFTSIASPQRAHSLQSIRLRRPRYLLHGASIPAGEIQRLSYEIFRPLASLASLRELVINLNHAISLNDEEFGSLVCNWPRLKILRLLGVREEHPAKSITLKGLLSLLESCHNLREIGMPVDARDVPLSESCSDVCRSSVTRVVFQDSPIEHSKLVAEFLSKHIPCVGSVRATFSDRRLLVGSNRKHQQLWTQVNWHRRKQRRSMQA